MSTLESVIWHLLGYAAIPVIVLLGLFLSTMAYYLLLRLVRRGADD